jgi:uncharacterized membrane protein YsdA (DUF1294 family)
MELVLIGLLLVNLWTLYRFWDDKQRAITGARRISEADLLFLALIGGSIGALVGRQLFRHKTRKQPFSTILLIIAGLQLGGVLGLFMPGGEQVMLNLRNFLAFCCNAP